MKKGRGNFLYKPLEEQEPGATNDTSGMLVQVGEGKNEKNKVTSVEAMNVTMEEQESEDGSSASPTPPSVHSLSSDELMKDKRGENDDKQGEIEVDCDDQIGDEATKRMKMALDEIDNKTPAGAINDDSFANGGFAPIPTNGWVENVAKFGQRTVTYLICQVSGNFVVGCKKNTAANRGWPFFMEIPDDLVAKHEKFRRLLQVGDEVEVQIYKWDERWKNLATKNEDVTKNKKFWLNPHTGLLPKQACAQVINKIIYGDDKWNSVVGVIYHIKKKVQNDPNSFLHAEVACRGLLTPATLVKRQLEGIDPASLKIGQLVTVRCALVPTDTLVDPRYILPRGSPFKMGSERRTDSKNPYRVLAMVGPHQMTWPEYSSDGIPKIFPCSAELTNEHIRCVEHVVGAALQIEAEREYSKMIEARFEGKAKAVEDDEFLLVFSKYQGRTERESKGLGN
jgi:hypothetical protein